MLDPEIIAMNHRVPALFEFIQSDAFAHTLDIVDHPMDLHQKTDDVVRRATGEAVYLCTRDCVREVLDQ